jgi:hypothetical protein
VKKRALVSSSVVVVGLVALFSMGGCTSVLGDFEIVPASVQPTDEAGAPDTGGQSTCTTCDGVCVDTQTSNAHCGGCNKSCVPGQTCTMGTCKCPDDASAFCNNTCVKASRQACGPSCAVCQADEVCSPMGCAPAPAPEFEKKPLDTTGWQTPSGDPIGFQMKEVKVPGTVYECRTGPAAIFNPTTPVWGNCDGGDGSKPIHKPTEDTNTPEGTYRTEYRFRNDTYRSPSIAHVYYVHHVLDRVPTCPRPGIADDGPKFTDDQYFQAAQAYSGANPALFPTVATFPQPSLNKNDPLVVFNPFIKIPFTNIEKSFGMLNGGYAWPAAGGDYLLNERSLRHKYVLNPTRTMLLVRRQYLHPTDRDCTQKFWIGSKLTANNYGPADLGRKRREITCEALVLNTRGHAMCIGRNAGGTAPEAIPIDRRPTEAGDGWPGTMWIAGSPATTATVTGGSVTVTLSNNLYGGNLNGYYVQLPAAEGGYPGGYWYKVTATTGGTLTLSEAYRFGNQSGVKIRYAHPTFGITNDFVIKTGYAKLHEDNHAHATGVANPTYPSPRTKCETPGCNTGKPWLTYLPP